MDKKELIEGHENVINNSKAEEALKLNPNLLTEITDKNKAQISLKVDEMVVIFNSITPYIERIKQFSGPITSHTRINCIYLLLCGTVRTFKSIFLLEKNFMNAEVMTLYRKAKEAIQLVQYICSSDDFNDKWFEGDLIMPKEARENLDKYVKEEFGDVLPIPIEGSYYDLANNTYRGESDFAHNGYTTLLESVCPFTKDFDFTDATHSHFTYSNSNYIKGGLGSLIIALKYFYSNVVKDDVVFNELDYLYNKNFPSSI